MQYRGNTDVMFSIQDPFSLNNRKIAQMLKHKKKKELSLIKLGVMSLIEDGVKVTWKKVKNIFKM